MSRQVKYVVGDFDGYFYTHQKHPLGAGENLPGGGIHSVHIYRGKLHNAHEFPNYQASTLLDSSSLLLHNVNNIEADLAEVDRKIFDFDQGVLKDIKITQSWEMNGKTYGIIKGKLYGKAKETSSTLQTESDQNAINPIAQTDSKKLSGTNIFSRPYWSSLREKNERSGCLSSIWDILKWILLLLLLYFLFTRMDGCAGGRKDPSPAPIIDSACCHIKDSVIEENRKLEEELDSVRKRNDSLIDSIEKEQIQLELDELSSKVFFLGGTTKIRQYSNNQLDQIVELLNKYPNLQVEVRGYRNYDPKETTPIIDTERAEVVKQLLIEKGLDPSRIDARGMGLSTIDDYLDLYTFYDAETNQNFKYNRNMRVEVKIIKY